MSRRVLTFIISITAILAIPHLASADYYSGNITYAQIPTSWGYLYVPQGSKPATVDSRIDPHLLKAAHIAQANSSAHSTLRCWRFVKDALLQAGAVTARPTTNYAFQAGSELTSHYGFTRLPIHNPYQAPVGAVLVYEGGGAGHVEFRTEHGFASDYHSPYACKYHLIGVYAKLSA